MGKVRGTQFKKVKNNPFETKKLESTANLYLRYLFENQTVKEAAELKKKIIGIQEDQELLTSRVENVEKLSKLASKNEKLTVNQFYASYSQSNSNLSENAVYKKSYFKKPSFESSQISSAQQSKSKNPQAIVENSQSEFTNLSKETPLNILSEISTRRDSIFRALHESAILNRDGADADDMMLPLDQWP